MLATKYTNIFQLYIYYDNDYYKICVDIEIRI